jgi:hypothetical protein
MAPSASPLAQRYQQLLEGSGEKQILECGEWIRFRPKWLQATLESSQCLMATLLRLPKTVQCYMHKRKWCGTYWCSYYEPYQRRSYEEPYRRWSWDPDWRLRTSYNTRAEDHPVYGVLQLWGTVLCLQNKRQQHSGLLDPDEGLSPIFYAAREGDDRLLMSLLCIITLSQIVRYLDASNDSKSSLDFVRRRCQSEQALTLRQWMEELRACRRHGQGPIVDVDSLFSVMAQRQNFVLPARATRRQKSFDVNSRRFTFGDLVRHVRTTMSYYGYSYADAVFLQEQLLRAMDSLELRVHPAQRLRPAPSTRKRPTPRRYHHFSRATTRKQLAVYEYDSDYNQDNLDESFDAELASDGRDNTTNNFNDGLARKRNAPNAEHLTGSLSAESLEVQRAEAVHDEESVEPAPECEYELVVDDITTNSWVVDGSQFIFDVSEGSLKQEWDLVSNFSAEIDEMSFESATTPDPVPHQTRPSYSQVVRFGQMSAVALTPESPTLCVIPTAPIKGRPPRKQTRIAGNDDDGNVLLFDAETIRDGSKRADRRRQRLNAKYRRRATRYYMTSYA